MKISYNWLKDFIQTGLDANQIADILTLTGLEVEETSHTGFNLEGVVVGEVLEVKAHENADRLRVCKVKTGTGPELQIVCGAPNVAAGQKVAVALIGALLPVKLEDGSFLKIKKTKIRGEISEGMICAEDELGLGEDHDGILVLDSELKPGTPFEQVHKVYKDTVFEIGLTPNRPDASCHIGVARDIAAVLDIPLQMPDVQSLNADKTLGDTISINIQNPEKCYRYIGMIVEGVNVGPSPEWLQNRLQAVGLRPINNVVDVTNYVMYEYGQPLHAFDYDLIYGKKIIVRDFDKDIPFKTLDETERIVPAGSVFICDGEKPVAIGGVMGGLGTGITENSQTVFIESASFHAVSIRKTSKHLALQTESSYRFERGVDPNITRAAAERCAQLIAETTGGKIKDGITDIYPDVIRPLQLHLRPEFLSRILGTTIETDRVIKILDRLGFRPEKKESVISCTVPTYRPDVTMEIDLVEEVARIYDYNNIPSTGRIAFAKPSALPREEIFHDLLRDTAKSLGFQEIYTNSLLSDGIAGLQEEESRVLRTMNPISKDQSVLRPSLGYGFLRTVAYNFNRLNFSLRFFETGNVFSVSDDGTYHEGIEEQPSLLLGVAGIRQKQHWSSPEKEFTFHDIKAASDALSRKLRLEFKLNIHGENIFITCSEKVVGQIFAHSGKILRKHEIDRPVFYAEFFIRVLQQLYFENPPVTYQPVPKYPPFDFDFAVVVEKTIAAGDLEMSTRNTGGKLLNSIEVFDIFEGKPLQDNEKSVAFRLRFIHDTKTLTIKDVEPIIENVLDVLEKKYNARLRSQ
jgi:phenylalanyl-tRNA synthetase beta chain